MKQFIHTVIKSIIDDNFNTILHIF